MSTLFNTFSHSACTASIRPVNLKRSIGERSLLTLLKKRSPTVKKSSSAKRCFSRTKWFLMIMRYCSKLLGSRRPRMKEYFVYLAETRHQDILYKKPEGKLEVFLYRNYNVVWTYPLPQIGNNPGVFSRSYVFLLLVFFFLIPLLSVRKSLNEYLTFSNHHH